MHAPNGQSEQGKGTDPCHASHPNGTSPYQTSTCGTLMSTGQTSRRGSTSGRQHTWSGHTYRRTSNRGRRCHQSGRARQHPSSGDTSSRKQRPHGCIPLRQGPQQAEEQPGKARQRGRESRNEATRNRRGRFHPRPRVASIPCSNNCCFHAIPVTPPKLPTPFPRP